MESSKSRFTDPVSEAIEASLDRFVFPGQAIVVGLSGGLDSTVLLHALCEPAGRRGLRLSSLHIHHALSPNADRWADHCRALTAAWEVPFSVVRVEVERGSADGLEAAARRARHAAFAGADAEWVALAHHGDDQAETLIFNLLRGTGLAGAAGMAELNGKLLRPLLSVPREELRRYAERHQVHWIEDESNDDTRFSRNHVRHEVLAGLERRFPGSKSNLGAAARRFREALDLLDDLAVLDLGGLADFPVPVGAFAKLAEPRARNALRYLLQKNRIGIPSEERLRELLRQLIEAAADRHPEATFGRWRIFRRAGLVCAECLQDGA
ncbi:MAG TPA: tRNA lysidine(34) synthetase TilS [Rhodocyclaceae bacterium]